MIKKLYVFFSVFFIAYVVGVNLSYAGFGITPPYVRNTSLTRNSVYEQQILMVRSDPSTPLNARITVDAPTIADWVEVLEGDLIAMPVGAKKVPVTVRVTVPDDAEFRRYSGKIRIKTAPPPGSETAGAVNISLGAQVDIDLTIIDREIFDFRVRKIELPDFNEGHKVGWLYFPAKINFGMRIENTGNVDVAPSDVVFKIYDSTGQTLLEETHHRNRIVRVQPFATEDVVAEIPTRLPAGSYLARYSIYNQDDIKQEGELTLNILPYGTLQTAGYGFAGLSLPHKVSIILPILTVLIIIGLLVYRRRS
ncbi:hypothetical protein CL655_03465 [bacterium]|nr:hypothetical protein [bacterium]|tara:strand:- start:2035 stop:2958 length:924 start_codon:yes stop_codon:yes gene_type:complete